jgi:hypothetical protein
MRSRERHQPQQGFLFSVKTFAAGEVKTAGTGSLLLPAPSGSMTGLSF